MSDSAFEPPKEYRFEPELAAPVPRPVTPELRQGRHGRKLHLGIRTFLICGFLCIASAQTGVVQTVGLYFLPLAHLRWIGVACLAGGLIMYLRDVAETGPYRQYKQGTAFIARILQLVVQPSAYYNGQPINWKFFAEIQFPDASGALVQTWTTSDDLGNRPDWYTTSYRVGEYATGLHLPGADEPYKLYGFLGLKPGLGVVECDPSGDSMTKARVRAIALGFLILGGIVLFLDALQVMPTRMPGGTFFLGLLGVSVVIAVPIGRKLMQKDAERTEALERRNAEAVAGGQPVLVDPRLKTKSRGQRLLETGLLVFSVFVGLFLFLVELNTYPILPRDYCHPVYLTEMVQTTHSFMIRDYQIKFQIIDEAGTKGRPISFITTPEHIATFKSRFGIVRLRGGLMGWPWAMKLYPVNPSPGEDPLEVARSTAPQLGPRTP